MIYVLIALSLYKADSWVLRIALTPSNNLFLSFFFMLKVPGLIHSQVLIFLIFSHACYVFSCSAWSQGVFPVFVFLWHWLCIRRNSIFVSSLNFWVVLNKMSKPSLFVEISLKTSMHAKWQIRCRFCSWYPFFFQFSILDSGASAMQYHS